MSGDPTAFDPDAPTIPKLPGIRYTCPNGDSWAVSHKRLEDLRGLGFKPTHITCPRCHDRFPIADVDSKPDLAT